MAKCIDCQYLYKTERDDLQCRRYPPVEVKGIFTFPIVLEKWWCGEFKRVEKFQVK